jgi:small GTP-binding protein
MIVKKIVMIGSFAVGKTSLIRRFVDNKFSEDYLTTIGVTLSKKIVTELDTQLMIWDIEGSTKHKPINVSYLMGAHGAIIVADLTREVTLEELEQHIQTVQKVKKEMPIIIALNKSDLIGDEEKQNSILNELQNKFTNYQLFLTSAKDGKNVENIFSKLAEKTLKG